VKRLVDLLIWLARRTPYSHLFHSDGSAYMQRFWLMPKWTLVESRENNGIYYRPARWMPFALRLHRICTPDYDQHFHDHPWNFASLVLRGGYIEYRPIGVEPSFFKRRDAEDHRPLIRLPGSIAFRRATDRYLIAYVMPETWTLFATGRKVHWWGFYTPKGKVHWREYPELPRGAREPARRW
jgi:hypothetical protein